MTVGRNDDFPILEFLEWRGDEDFLEIGRLP